jgi:hypothetical protein
MRPERSSSEVSAALPMNGLLPATNRSSTPSPCSALRFPHAEPPVPALEGHQRFEVVGLPEVGPQRVGEEELRVRRLPQQEVAQPQLAAGPDEQVGVRILAGGARFELVGEQRLVDVLGPELLALHLLRELPARLHDVPSPAVTDCQGQVEL